MSDYQRVSNFGKATKTFRGVVKCGVPFIGIPNVHVWIQQTDEFHVNMVQNI